MGAPNCKFEIIHETLPNSNNKLSVRELCSIAGVSRSGYYNCLKSAETREKREIADQEDFALILAAYEFPCVAWVYDNAIMESFYRTLKRELVQDAHYENPEQARQDNKSLTR